MFPNIPISPYLRNSLFHCSVYEAVIKLKERWRRDNMTIHHVWYESDNQSCRFPLTFTKGFFQISDHLFDKLAKQDLSIENRLQNLQN